MLRVAGLIGQPVEASPVERKETPVRESCGCGGEDEFQYREAVLDDGEWVLRCPECGHLDRLLWLSEEGRALLVGMARRRWRVRVRRAGLKATPATTYHRTGRPATARSEGAGGLPTV